MAVKAYVLINTETALTRQVADKIRRLGGVLEVNEILGPYDVLAELEADRLEEVTEVLREKIRSIPGVRTTVTCVTKR